MRNKRQNINLSISKNNLYKPLAYNPLDTVLGFFSPLYSKNNNDIIKKTFIVIDGVIISFGLNIELIAIISIALGKAKKYFDTSNTYNKNIKTIYKPTKYQINLNKILLSKISYS